MPHLPNQLTWALTKNSSFVVKRGHAGNQFNRDSLTGDNSFVSSGIANKQSVGLSVEKKGNGEQVVLTIRTKSNKGVKSVKVPLRNDPRRSARIIKKATSGNFYRSDLTRAALARYTRLQKSTTRKARGVSFKPKSGRSNKKN